MDTIIIIAAVIIGIRAFIQLPVRTREEREWDLEEAERWWAQEDWDEARAEYDREHHV